jgi:hypothetical protein
MAKRRKYLLDEPVRLARVDHGEECPKFVCQSCQEDNLCVHEITRSVQLGFDLHQPFHFLLRAVTSILKLFQSNYPFVICIPCMRAKQDYRMSENVRTNCL